MGSWPLLISAATDREDSQATLTVEFEGVEGEVLENIRRHVRLVNRLQSGIPFRANELSRLKGRVKDEVLQAVEPFGFYNTIVTTVSGNVGDRPDVSTADKLVYRVDLNEPVLVRRVDLQLIGATQAEKMFTEWRNDYPLKKGGSLIHLTYEAAKRNLQALALRQGYFDARYVKSQIEIDETRSFADITMHFDAGKRYVVSGYEVQWMSSELSEKTNLADNTKGENTDTSKPLIDEDLLAVLISVKPDEAYDIDTLAKTQKALAATPYFSVVDVQPGELDEVASTVPVVIKLTPTKKQSYSFEIGVGTDTGVRGGVGYENRRINSRGHNLNVRLGGSQIEKSANLNYRIPLTRKATDSLDFYATLEESDDFRDFEKSSIGSQLLLDWRGAQLNFGLQASRERSFSLNDELMNEELVTDLLMPSIGWQKTSVDDLYFPNKGWEASFSARAGSESFGSDIDLAQAIFSANVLYPFMAGRLKFRFKLAGSLIDDPKRLPESLGFLTGGDESVRGYSFESIGVMRNGEITVAKNEIVGSIEYQHPLKNELALATFFDAGDAFNTSPDYKRGAGIGLRWRLPFGALRLDLATALDIDGDPWRLHFGFGTHL